MIITSSEINCLYAYASYYRDLTRTSLTAMNNFTFPDALVSLNLSGNAIRKVAGVAFPSSLAYLSLNSMKTITPSDVADTSSMFEEFEVRQSDADNFAKLKLFNVAPTVGLICSDTRARRVYVQNTMLCVLTNEVFSTKYGDISSDGSSGSGSGTAPLEVIKEDIHQTRSWFLIIAVAGLGGFVACVFIVALCRVWGRRLIKKRPQQQGVKTNRSRRRMTDEDDSRDDGRWDKLV